MKPSQHRVWLWHLYHLFLHGKTTVRRRIVFRELTRAGMRIAPAPGDYPLRQG